MSKLQVTHFHRRPRPNVSYSIEGFYENVRNTLKEKAEIKVVTCPFMSNGFFRRLYNCIYAAFKQNKINHITGDVNYLNLFFRKSKNIITILDCGLLQKTKGIKHQIAKLLWYSIPITRSKYVVAISQATKDEILKYVKCDPKKIKVIHISVTPVFKRAHKEFNKKKPVVLHVGTTVNKNLSRLIKAIAGLDYKLSIVGLLTDEYLDELKEHKIDYENFVNLTDEELFEKYKNCDLLFFASTYEGFGMPIVEANVVGRAVITSNLLSMPEVAGDAALLLDPYKVDEIRNGIKKIIDDDAFRNELINKGFKNAERFTLKKMAADYLQLYQSVS